MATFSDHDDRVFDSVHNRLTQISPRSKFGGLNKYVVTNYGLNGHYLPHNKYVDEDHRINSDGRQAIVIFHVMYTTQYYYIISLNFHQSQKISSILHTHHNHKIPLILQTHYNNITATRLPDTRTYSLKTRYKFTNIKFPTNL